MEHNQLDQRQGALNLFPDSRPAVSNRVYPRSWTPAQHFQILHGESPADTVVTINFKLKSDTAIAFWQEIEDARVAGLMAAREARKAAGVKRLGGMPRARQYADYKHTMQERKYAKGDLLNSLLARLGGIPDVYVNQNSFYGRRLIARFMQARHLYLDIDKLAETFGLPPHEVCSLLLAYCLEVNIPEPSFVLSTGAGLCAVWRHTPVNFSFNDKEEGLTLEDWNTAERSLFKLFKDRFKPDPAAKDVTRIFRLSGTTNTKNGNAVHPIFVSGDDHDPVIYDFGQLALSIATALAVAEEAKRKLVERIKAENVVLIDDADTDPAPAQKATVEAVTAAKAEKAKRTLKVASMSLRTDFETMCQELGRIEREQMPRMKNARYAGVLSDVYLLWKSRGGKLGDWCDNWLFISTLSLAQGGYYGKSLEAEVLRLCKFVEIPPDQALATMENTIERADMAAATGNEDHLYQISNEAACERLLVTLNERATVPLQFILREGGKKYASEQQYQRVKKAKARGQITAPRSREEIAQEIAERDAEIAKLKSQGMSVRKIAETLGVPKSTVSRAFSTLSASVSCVSSGVPLVPPNKERGATTHSRTAKREERKDEDWVQVDRQKCGRELYMAVRDGELSVEDAEAGRIPTWLWQAWQEQENEALALSREEDRADDELILWQSDMLRNAQNAPEAPSLDVDGWILRERSLVAHKPVRPS